MKQKAEKLLKNAKKTLGEDTDIMMITYKDGQCTTFMHGKTENLAHALFTCIHDNNPIGKELYNMVRLNVLNILNNPSPYAIHLSDSIINALPINNE